MDTWPELLAGGNCHQRGGAWRALVDCLGGGREAGVLPLCHSGERARDCPADDASEELEDGGRGGASA
jgi:hypothetical protein